MNKRSVLLILGFSLAAYVGAVAQDSMAAGPNAQSQSSVANGGEFRRIEGCLAYNGVSYVLAVVSNGPKQYRVVGGDVDALRGKVGHTVEIDGPTRRNNPQAMIENWDQREATTGVGWYTITADQVRDVTSNCSYPGFEHPASHVNMD